MADVNIFCPQFLPKYLPKGLILNYFIGEMQQDPEEVPWVSDWAPLDIMQWVLVCQKTQKSQDYKQQTFEPKNFDFQNQSQYFENIDIDFDIEFCLRKFLIMILILSMGKF